MTEQTGRPLHEPRHLGVVGQVLEPHDQAPVLLPRSGWNAPVRGRVRLELREEREGALARRGKANVVFQLGTRRFEPFALALWGGPAEAGMDVWVVGEVARAAGATTESRWRALWNRLGVERVPWSLHGALVAAWSSPRRVHHDVDRLLETLVELERVAPLAERRDEAELALWFHDAVLLPTSEGSEESSADLARRTLPEAGLAADATERVAQLVLATRNDGTPLEGDAALVADVDLAILGADEDRYEAYEWDLRAEHGWVPASRFLSERRARLESLLRRPRLFHTAGYRERLDARAKANIARTLLHLQ